MSYPQQPAPAAPAPMAPAPAAPVQQAQPQQAPAPDQQPQPQPQDQGGQSATDQAMGDPVAWQVAAEADARYSIVQRPLNGQVG